VEIESKYRKQLQALIKRLLLNRASQPGKPVAFRGNELELAISILDSAVKLKPGIPEADYRVLIRGGLLAAFGEAKPNPTTLEEYLGRFEAEYLKKPEQKYILATSMGITNYYGEKTKLINGVGISLRDVLPRRFDRTPINEDVQKIVGDVPLNTVQLLATVSARTPSAAFESVQKSVDLLRGLWNYILISPTITVWRYGGPPEPINRILPGVLHTLHKPNGTLAAGGVWYEPEVIKTNRVYTADGQWLVVQKKANKLFARLRSIKYGADLEIAIVRYTRALDSTDYDASFSRLWSVLEYLTGNPRNYDDVIKRVGFLMADSERELIQLLLQHLRDVRNGFVHANETRSNIESYLYQLKLMTERLIRFHLKDGPRFSCRAEAIEFLDTPIDKAILMKKLRHYRTALRIKR
jgi:hypothetical protein